MLRVAFQNFTNAPKDEIHWVHIASHNERQNYTPVYKCQYQNISTSSAKKCCADKRRTFLGFFVLAILQWLSFPCVKMSALQTHSYRALLSLVPLRTRVSHFPHLSHNVWCPVRFHAPSISACCPHSVFIPCVCFLLQTATTHTYLNNIKRPVCVMGRHCVFYEVRILLKYHLQHLLRGIVRRSCRKRRNGQLQYRHSSPNVSAALKRG